MQAQGQLVQEIHLLLVHLKEVMEGPEQKDHQAMEQAVVVERLQLELQEQLLPVELVELEQLLALMEHPQQELVVVEEQYIPVHLLQVLVVLVVEEEVLEEQVP